MPNGPVPVFAVPGGLAAHGTKVKARLLPHSAPLKGSRRRKGFWIKMPIYLWAAFVNALPAP